MVYFKRLEISLLKLRFSFLSIKDYRSSAIREADVFNQFLARNLGSTLSIPTIDKGRLVFSGQLFVDYLARLAVLQHELTLHYQQQAQSQILRLAFSADMLG